MPNAVLIPTGLVDAPDTRRRITPQDYELMQRYLAAINSQQGAAPKRLTLADLFGKKKKHPYVTSD